MLNEQEIENLLKGDGRVNEIRNYVICMGQSSGSKGVMFVMYSELKKCESVYVNPFIYLGQLADDFENAVINARLKYGMTKLSENAKQKTLLITLIVWLLPLVNMRVKPFLKYLI